MRRKHHSPAPCPPPPHAHYPPCSYSSSLAAHAHRKNGGKNGTVAGTDGGDNWIELNVIERKITALAVAATPDDNKVSVAMCTYVDGCYSTDVDLRSLRHATAPVYNPSMAHWEHVSQQRTNYPWLQYNVVSFSPAYGKDGLVVQATANDVFASRDHGVSWRRWAPPETISPPAALKGPQSRVSQVLVVDAGTATPLVFLSGINYGVMVSVDRGHVFTRLWGPFASTRYNLALSPAYRSDKTMIAITSSIDDKENRCKVNDARIHISRDSGASWTALPRASAFDAWEWIALSPRFATDKVMIALKNTMASPCPSGAADTRSFADYHTGQLYLSRDAGQSWVYIRNQQPYTATLRNAGVGRGGLALAPTFGPGGGEMIATLQEGGIIRGYINTTTRSFESVDHVTKTGRDLPFTFAHPPLVRVNHQRSLGSLVVFSPHYAADSVVFGASFSTLMVSFDGGRAWKEIVKMVPMSTNCSGAGCLVCDLHRRSTCKRCDAGFRLAVVPVELDGMTWPATRSSGGSKTSVAGVCHRRASAAMATPATTTRGAATVNLNALLPQGFAAPETAAAAARPNTSTTAAASCNIADPNCAEMPLALCGASWAGQLTPDCQQMCKLCAGMASINTLGASQPKADFGSLAQLSIGGRGDSALGDAEPESTASRQPARARVSTPPTRVGTLSTFVARTTVQTMHVASPCRGGMSDFAPPLQGLRGSKLRGRGLYFSGRVFANRKFYTLNISECAVVCAASDTCYGFDIAAAGVCRPLKRVGVAAEARRTLAGSGLYLKRLSCAARPQEATATTASTSCPAGVNALAAFVVSDVDRDGRSLQGGLSKSGGRGGTWPPPAVATMAAKARSKQDCAAACHLDGACQAFLYAQDRCMLYDAVAVGGQLGGWAGRLKTSCPMLATTSVADQANPGGTRAQHCSDSAACTAGSVLYEQARRRGNRVRRLERRDHQQGDMNLT